MSFTMETLYQLWDDECGARIEIGPDRDGLELVEIRSYDENNKLHTSMVFTQEQIKLMIPSLMKMCDIGAVVRHELLTEPINDTRKD